MVNSLWVGVIFMVVNANPLSQAPPMPFGQAIRYGFESEQNCYQYYMDFKDWEVVGAFGNLYNSSSKTLIMDTPIGQGFVSCIPEKRQIMKNENETKSVMGDLEEMVFNDIYKYIMEAPNRTAETFWKEKLN